MIVVYIKRDFILDMTFGELMDFKAKYGLWVPNADESKYVDYSKRKDGPPTLAYLCKDEKTKLVLELKYG
jgi:hypothetical protein